MRLLHISVILSFFYSATYTNAQELEIKSGFWRISYYQYEQQIEKEMFLEVLKADNMAYSFWESSKTFETLTYPTAILATGFIVWNIKNISDDEFDAVPAIGGLISGIAGLIFLNKIEKNRRKAIETFNQNLKNKTTFRIQPSPKGIGIVLVIN